MSYPNMETYRKLYARYIAENGRPVSELMDLAGGIEGKTVLDLCGGAGEIALEAVNRGASPVMMADRQTDMADVDALIANDVDVRDLLVEELLSYDVNDGKFDVVFCRQAVNYWMTSEMVKLLSERIVDGGQFIFNTFNQRPSRLPSTKGYEIDGLRYVEASWWVSATNMIQHVQCCEGMEPHVTSFRWISPEQFLEFLESFFEVEVFTKGNTNIYRCTKQHNPWASMGAAEDHEDPWEDNELASMGLNPEMK